jgi:hypothetical protein
MGEILICTLEPLAIVEEAYRVKVITLPLIEQT